jgi:hypothetical protein
MEGFFLKVVQKVVNKQSKAKQGKGYGVQKRVHWHDRTHPLHFKSEVMAT